MGFLFFSSLEMEVAPRVNQYTRRLDWFAVDLEGEHSAMDSQILEEHTEYVVYAIHRREHFPFLHEYRCSRSRTAFYYTIGWLIFMEDSPVKFKSSMDPLLQVFINLESIPDAMFRTDSVKYALIGLMRDLRGIAMATNSRRTYGLLFDWLYPAHMPILLKGISHWADTPEPCLETM